MEYKDNKGDFGADLAQNVLAVLRELDFPREAADELLETMPIAEYAVQLQTLFKRYALPEHLEELFTLWGERHQVYVISGIHERKEGGAVGFVAVEYPIMYWEWRWAAEGKFNDEHRPAWVPEKDLEQLEFYFDFVLDGELPVRFYYPLLAEFLKNPFENRNAYQRRRQAVVEAIKTLHQDFGFKVRYTESGDIPKEIPDEWLSIELLEYYNDCMAFVESGLEKDPYDPQPWFEKAGLLLSRDRAEEAMHNVKKSLELDNRSPWVWYLLSDIYTRLGSEEEAKSAEMKAKRIQKEEGIPESQADLYDMLNWIFIGIAERREQSRPPEKERLICDSCDYEFLYVREGIWYACNGCGYEHAIENAALEITLSSQLKRLDDIWDRDMEFEVLFINKTRFGITLSTGDMELWLESEELGRIMNALSGSLPTPHQSLSILPGQQITMQFHSGDIIWGEDEGALHSLGPGSYFLYMFVTGTVMTDWGELDAISESNAIYIESNTGE